MKNNLVTKVLYRTIFCTVSFFAILFITDFFSTGGHNNVTFTKDFFYFYTNLSNFLCFGVMIACLCDDVKQLRAGKTHGYNKNPILRMLKFSATLIISITLIAYGILLGEPGTIAFWNNISNVCYHVVAPLMFIIDTILFDEHKKIGVFDTFIAMIPPVIYVIVIEIMGIQTGRYPYFFLDMKQLGFGGLMMWIGILLLLFAVLGYMLFFYDKLVKKDGKWKIDLSNVKMLNLKNDEEKA